MKKTKLILLYIAVLSVMILLGACDTEGGDTSDNASDGNTAISSTESSKYESVSSNSSSSYDDSDMIPDDGMYAASSDVNSALDELSDILSSSNSASSGTNK